MLADGTPWSVPVTLDVPAGAVPADADRWQTGRTRRAPRWSCSRSPNG